MSCLQSFLVQSLQRSLLPAEGKAIRPVVTQASTWKQVARTETILNSETLSLGPCLKSAHQLYTWPRLCHLQQTASPRRGQHQPGMIACPIRRVTPSAPTADAPCTRAPPMLLSPLINLSCAASFLSTPLLITACVAASIRLRRGRRGPEGAPRVCFRLPHHRYASPRLLNGVKVLFSLISAQGCDQHRGSQLSHRVGQAVRPCPAIAPARADSK